MVADGRLVREARGLYALPDAEVTAQHSLAVVAKAVPKGVICLLSALRFHDIGTQLPHEVWLAIERRAAEPRLASPRLRIVRFSGPAFTEGVEEHDVEGTTIRVYGMAKTIADCFKYRNKIGLDVALEALKEILRDRRCTVEELRRYARVCRVLTVMRPYMEALI
jgi:predicted transcriptional regulator of viral defense system